jgi:hypothetical protein
MSGPALRLVVGPRIQQGLITPEERRMASILGAIGGILVPDAFSRASWPVAGPGARTDRKSAVLGSPSADPGSEVLSQCWRISEA